MVRSRSENDRLPAVWFPSCAAVNRLLSSSHDESLKLWDATYGKCIVSKDLPGIPHKLALSQNSKQILVATTDGLLQDDATILQESGPRLYHP